jgi:Uma2 family endonuclease
MTRGGSRPEAYAEAVALQLPWGAPLTYDDLRNIPEDGHRYELLDGALLVTPAPNRAHQRCVLAIAVLLRDAAPPELEVIIAPFDWLVGPTTSFEPDVLVARRVDVGAQNLSHPPVLAVEVLSPSTRRIDLVLKREAYAAAGVPSYWIVDPDVPSVTFLRLEGSAYVEDCSVAGEERSSTSVPFPVTVVPARLLD